MDKSDKKKIPAKNSTESKPALASGLKWIIPLFVLTIAGAGALYYYKDENSSNQKNVAVVNKDSVLQGNGTIRVSWDVDPVETDSTEEVTYNEGNIINISLPNKAGDLLVGENSTEARLINFLQSHQPVDTGTGNWFEFTDVHFTSGSTILSDSSLDQLQNIAKITKAFPTAIFKIGGYTDSTGNEDANIVLSKNRAEAVATKIKNFGARRSSISGSDGYGSRFALMENLTAAGRSLKRRVAIEVKAK